MKVTPEKYRAIMAGLERAKISVEWTKGGGEFIPHPATWLNAGGWENEYRSLNPSPHTPPAWPLGAAVTAGKARHPDDALERRRRLAEGGEIKQGSQPQTASSSLLGRTEE